ncbi:MAG: hypothetical protein ABL966_05060 [Acidimicrobiales bacterium]
MRRMVGALTLIAIAVALAACGSDDQPEAAATTTTTIGSSAVRPGCPEEFGLPLEDEVSDECRYDLLASVAEQEGVDLAESAEAEATALCEEISTEGVVEASAGALFSWSNGDRPAPSADGPGFVTLAVGVYCPEHWDELRELGTG